MHLSATSSNALPITIMSFVLSLEDQPADAAVRRRRRGASAAVEAAARAGAGIIAQAPPPGTLGVRTLWAAMLVFLVAALLRPVLRMWIGF